MIVSMISLVCESWLLQAVSGNQVESDRLNLKGKLADRQEPANLEVQHCRFKPCRELSDAPGAPI